MTVFAIWTEPVNKFIWCESSNACVLEMPRPCRCRVHEVTAKTAKAKAKQVKIAERDDPRRLSPPVAGDVPFHDTPTTPLLTSISFKGLIDTRDQTNCSTETWKKKISLIMRFNKISNQFIKHTSVEIPFFFFFLSLY